MKKENKMTREQFQTKCYEAYQLQWMINHGASLTEFLNTITEAACETMGTDDDYAVISFEKELTDLLQESRDSFDDIGFCGSLFACKDEFLQTEYLNPDYMHHLLSQMPDSENCRKLWADFTGLHEPVIQPERICHMPVRNGTLDITMNNDPDYPGLDIEYVSEKEELLPKDVPYTRPRVLIENHNDKLRALIWGQHDSEDYSVGIEFTCAEDLERGNE